MRRSLKASGSVFSRVCAALALVLGAALIVPAPAHALAPQPVGNLVGPRGEIGETPASRRAVLLHDHKCGVVGLRRIGGDLVKPIEGKIELRKLWPPEFTPGAVVFGTECQQVVPCFPEIIGH